ncbi:hypothetical protein B0H13DRAFT_1882342 [Mycena leptocephala]|nr:hypothetical protein B0H13DRAFT_1882342 [Mycena leptocephala]
MLLLPFPRALPWFPFASGALPGLALSLASIGIGIAPLAVWATVRALFGLETIRPYHNCARAALPCPQGPIPRVPLPAVPPLILPVLALLHLAAASPDVPPCACAGAASPQAASLCHFCSHHGLTGSLGVGRKM